MTASSATQIGATPLRLPVSVVLGATVVLATVLHATLALRSPSLWIVPDELIYSELAKSLAEGGLPKIRGEVSFAYGLGYPALLAPVWAVFDDVTKAYAVAKVLNALILSLTTVPAYFLARRFVAETYALVVAALAVIVPSMLYAGTLMTEVALYPAFVLALLAVTVALERPGLATQVTALGAIALVCTIKELALVLVAAYVSAIPLYHWLDTRSWPGWRTRLRFYAPTWITLAAIAVASGAVLFASGRQPQDVLGAYSVVLRNIDLLAVPWWALLHVAELDLYLAVIPFAATLAIASRGLRSGADRRERLFVALVVPMCSALVIVVAAFASTPTPGGVEYPETVVRLQERSTFVLVPLFFIGLALCLNRPPPQRAVLLAVVGAALFPALIPLDDFDSNVRFQAPALVPWVAVKDDLLWPFDGVMFGLALGVVFVLGLRVRASTAFVVAPVVFVLAMTNLMAHLSREMASKWTLSVGSGATPAWVDAAVGDQESVSVLWAESARAKPADLDERHRIVYLAEFFNRSVGEVYELGSPMPYGLPSTRVRLEEGRVVLDDGRPARLGEFVLVPCYVHVAGPIVVRDPATGAGVFRVQDPVRARVAKPDSCEGSR